MNNNALRYYRQAYLLRTKRDRPTEILYRYKCDRPTKILYIENAIALPKSSTDIKAIAPFKILYRYINAIALPKFSTDIKAIA